MGDESMSKGGTLKLALSVWISASVRGVGSAHYPSCVLAGTGRQSPKPAIRSGEPVPRSCGVGVHDPDESRIPLCLSRPADQNMLRPSGKRCAWRGNFM